MTRHLVRGPGALLAALLALSCGPETVLHTPVSLASLLTDARQAGSGPLPIGVVAASGDTAQQTVVLQAGAAFEVGLHLEAGAVLEIGNVSLRGAVPHLSVRIQHAGEREPTELRLSASQEATVVPLAEAAGPTLLALEVPVQPGAAGHVVLRDASVRGVVAPELPVSSPYGAQSSGDADTARALPHVVVYLIDTLRADRLGVYGADDGLTPHMDAFARGATVFAQAASQSSWTRASVATLFTGLYPHEHGTNRRAQALAQEHLTLAEALREAGYETAAFLTNPNVTPEFGMTQGFDHVWFELEANSDVVGARVEEYLDGRGDSDRPLLLYVHTIDPHAPYDPPEEWRARFASAVTAEAAERSLRTLFDLQAGRAEPSDELQADLEALYDAEVAFNDASFGALLARLESVLGANLVVALVSDHGEEFAEHGGWQHGRTLLEESVHVPMMLRLPKGLGVAPPARVEGPSEHLDLVRLLQAAVFAPRRLEEHFAQLQAPDRLVATYLHLDGRPRFALRTGNDKVVFRAAGGRLDRDRLFDLGTDPREAANLALERPVRLALLRTWAQRHLREGLARREIAAPDVEIDETMRRNLEALGYLGGR